MSRHVVFSHGQDGEPWGTKIQAMAAVVRRHGLQVHSVDYRGMPDPLQRVRTLLEFAAELPGEMILVGSSMGGHVAMAAATQLRTCGVFLLAPAFYMAGYEHYTPQAADCPVDIVHGWNDDIVPVDNSIRYARENKCTLHVLDSDHRLTADIDEVCALLDRFLTRLPTAPA